ncbi:MFS transporter [Vallitalea maricola]|uniref:Tetracycline efflux MFS transporter TetA(P) n=1 Tax=Vallitalea maricola TaxID=3074433 RepID=A0ACB5ULW1_9FIRM|nr:tetracycline efflux MFS transporter TetA(P) [Vallitalea sp. AN17-2]
MNKKIPQLSIYLIYTGAAAFFFSLVFTVNQVYYIEILELNPFQLVLIGTVLETSCFIFEIPTGIVADIVSRKLSVIIGLVLMGIAFIAEGSIPLFITVIFSQILWGLGYTFTSGADEAWIADELDGRNLDGVYLRGAQVGQFGSLLGILVSVVIGTVRVNIPMIIGGLSFIVLAIFLVVFMKETKFKPASTERNTWKQIGYTFSQGIKFIRGKSILMLMVGMSLLYGLYSEGLDRLWTAHFMQNIGFTKLIELKPVVWIGIINGFAMVLSILVVQYVKKRMNKTGEIKKVWMLIPINILMVMSIVLFGLSGNFSMAISMYLTFYITRIINGPIYRAWMSKNIKSEVRATVLSTYGQIDSFGQIIGGPLIGFIAVKTSISTAIVLSGIILSPIIVIFIYVYGKYQSRETKGTKL